MSDKLIAGTVPLNAEKGFVRFEYDYEYEYEYVLSIKHGSPGGEATVPVENRYRYVPVLKNPAVGREE